MRAMTPSRFVATAALVAALAAAASREPAEARPTNTGIPVPILMYHVVADPRPGAPYPELFVSEPDFAAQMRWLDRHGITREQAAKKLEVARRHIDRLCTGERRPDLELAVKIEDMTEGKFHPRYWIKAAPKHSKS